MLVAPQRTNGRLFFRQIIFFLRRAGQSLRIQLILGICVITSLDVKRAFMENHRLRHLCGFVSKTEISVQEVTFDFKLFLAEKNSAEKTKAI